MLNKGLISQCFTDVKETAENSKVSHNYVEEGLSPRQLKSFTDVTERVVNPKASQIFKRLRKFKALRC